MEHLLFSLLSASNIFIGIITIIVGTLALKGVQISNFRLILQFAILFIKIGGYMADWYLKKHKLISKQHLMVDNGVVNFYKKFLHKHNETHITEAESCLGSGLPEETIK